jgi:uncharacterized repeat protein (TIGR01451 family)
MRKESNIVVLKTKSHRISTHNSTIIISCKDPFRGDNPMFKNHTFTLITLVYAFILFTGQFTYAAYIAIAPGEYKTGSLAPGEMHTYSFNASADDSVTILMSQSSHVYEYGEKFEPHLELHAPDGTVLAVNSDSDSAIVQSVRIPQRGTCFILAREKDGFDAGDYGLSLVKIPGTVTVNDPNGGSINPGEYKKGIIEPGDMDSYTFTASAGDSITILMSQSSQVYNYDEIFEPLVELYAPDGTAVDANSGSDSATIQSARVPQSGTCFIIAREKDGSDVGDYCLSLLKVPWTANCGTIDPGEYTTGRIEPGEIDSYAFTASAGDSITILASQIGDQYDERFEPRVELHAPDGTVLAVNSGSDSATIQSVKGPQSGTYLITVRDQDGLDAWDYGLSLFAPFIDVTPGDLNEVSSTEDTLVETIYIEEWTSVDGNVVGDVNGTFALNDFELVTIGTGFWTGKGFSRALCEATLEGATYRGEWKGIAFSDADTSEIRLRGSIIGEILATVDGTLTESVPGSRVYDQYQATWKIGKLNNTTTTATVITTGTLINRKRYSYPSTGLYVLQTAMDGTLAGDYSGPLSTVISHVEIAQRNNPYNGCGFSVISYVCESGLGEGYTCDELNSPGVLTMRGMFTDPLYGVLSATLNEPTTPRGTTTSRVLHLFLQRIDLGLPPAPDLRVFVSGPRRASPGQTVTYTYEIRNDGLVSAKNVALIGSIPFVTDFISLSTPGIYDEVLHIVKWNLDTISPKTVKYLSVNLQIFWGLPSGTVLVNSVNTYSKEVADDIFNHASPIMSRSEKEILEFIVGFVFTSPFPCPIPEGYTLIQFLGGEGGINVIIIELAILERKASEDQEWEKVQYFSDVIALLTALKENPDYLKNQGKTFCEAIGELKNRYNIPEPDGCPTVITTARDPNRKTGPQGNVVPGQKLDYKVEYENEGEGIAFGVYFTDTLDEDVDDSTLEIGPVIDVHTGLQIAPPGIYIPATRTIIWFVGQVDPNQGGYADFSVNVKPDAADGTEIINFSTVYFPSVPEATRTNAIVSTVNKVTLTVSASIMSQDVQYSDSIEDVIFIATSVSANTMNASVSYSTDGGRTFGSIMTLPPTLALPDDTTIPGGLAFKGDIVQVGTGTWTLAGVADLAPGMYIIRLNVSDGDGASESIDTAINVLQEDVFAIYVGAESVSTPSASDSMATVELLAVIVDMTTVSPASDSDAGNITKARVTFVNRDSGAVIAEGIPVILLNYEGLTVGLARYEWVVDIGSQDSVSFTVGIIVNGYYTRNNSDDNTVVTVSKPVVGSI